VTDTRTKLRPAEVAERFSVCVETVLSWVKSGELRAINVSARRDCKKPRYLISEADILAFEKLRVVVAVSPCATGARPARRNRQTKGVVEFF
jgi:hypothetical protein